MSVQRPSARSLLRDRLERVERRWSRYWSARGGDETMLLRPIHGLAVCARGSRAGEIEELASEMERLLCRGRPGGGAREAMLHATMAELRRAFDRLQEPATRRSGPTPEEPVEYVGAPLIYFLEARPGSHRRLRESLGRYGYVARTFEEPESLVGELDSAPPEAVVVELEPGVSWDDPRSFEGFRARLPRRVPVFVTVEQAGFWFRASHLGGDEVLSREGTAEDLLDALERRRRRVAAPPLAVLMLVSRTERVTPLAAELEGRGVLVAVHADVGEGMARLGRGRWDLLVVEVFLRQTSGLELARAVRRQTRLAAIPVVLLADEIVLRDEQEAFRAGVDDYLPAYLPPAHLAERLTSRATRCRELRTLSTRDGLTGLARAVVVEEELKAAVARAQREKEPAALGRLDVDGLRRVNDAQGCEAGDRVLAVLGRLLTGRVRRCDVVGRMGGDEIAVVFRDTDGPAALRILDEVRHRLSGLRLPSPSGVFSVTLSGGVAAYPEFGEFPTLMEAAGLALQQAKRSGGNRVILKGRETGRRVLVIEDDEELLGMLECVLSRHGYDVETAEDGLDGFRMATRVRPDLIISDVLVPRLDGFALCEAVKSDPLTADVPVILTTGVYRKYLYQVAARDRGAEVLLEKPLRMATLMAKVEALMAPPRTTRSGGPSVQPAADTEAVASRATASTSSTD